MTPHLEALTKVAGNAAQIASALIAAAAVTFAYFQIEAIKFNNRESAALNRESAARSMYQAQLRLEFDNPKFAAAQLDQISTEGVTELNRYKVFIALLLYTCEEIMFTMPEDTNWRASCDMRIALHTRAICQHVTDQELRTYDTNIQILVGTIIRRAKRNSVAECERR